MFQEKSHKDGGPCCGSWIVSCVMMARACSSMTSGGCGREISVYHQPRTCSGRWRRPSAPASFERDSSLIRADESPLVLKVRKERHCLAHEGSGDTGQRRCSYRAISSISATRNSRAAASSLVMCSVPRAPIGALVRLSRCSTARRGISLWAERQQRERKERQCLPSQLPRWWAEQRRD